MEITTKWDQNYDVILLVQKVHKQLVWRTKMYMRCMPYPSSAASHLKCLLPLFVSAYICMCCFYFSTAYVLMCFNFIYVLLCFLLCFYIWFWCMIWCYVVLFIYLYSRFKSSLQGRIQDFKLGGRTYNNSENFCGISCEKSRFYAKKSYFFFNFRGDTRRGHPLDPPLL